MLCIGVAAPLRTRQAQGDRNHHLSQLKRLTGAFLENIVKTEGRMETISLPLMENNNLWTLFNHPS